MIERHDHDDKAALASALTAAVIADLNAGISARGAASLAVSGGSTPKQFFVELAARTNIDWSKVVITLVDERWVDDSSDRSNARLVHENLMVGPAAKAVFTPLYSGGNEPTAEAIAKTNEMLEDVPHPFDAVILGMGNDGHTASFFPGGDTLRQALSDKGPSIAIHAPGAGEARVTLTLPHLLVTRSLYLHIEGAEKAETLDKAMGEGEVAQMPVRAVLRQESKPVNIYWCP